MNKFCDKWCSKVLALLRIIMGFLIFWHGTQKLFDYPPSETVQEELSALLLIAAVLEFLGGIPLMIGLFTRWTAFILSGMMVVAYCMIFISKSFLPLIHGGELAVLYCFTFFYLFFAGSGSFSIDKYLQQKKKKDIIIQ